MEAPAQCDLCEMAAKDASQFWKVLKTSRHYLCPVELSAQFEAFKILMGAEPMPAPKLPTTPGVCTLGLESVCLNDDITLDELCSCIKRLQRGKIPDIDGVVADMTKDGGDLVNECLLWLFKRVFCPPTS